MAISSLHKRFPIINDDGTPTDYFMRVLRDRGIFSEDTAQQVIGKANNTTQIVAGTGLSGGGTLEADRTISLNAGLDDLTDVDLTTTPPADGEALVFDNGSGTWIPGTVAGGGGGGGGIFEKIGSPPYEPSSGVIDISGLDLSSYAVVKAVFVGLTVSTDTSLYLQLRLSSSGLVTSGYKRLGLNYSTSGSSNNGNSTSSSVISLSSNTGTGSYSVGSGTGKNANGEIWFWNPGGSALHKHVSFKVRHNYDTTNHGEVIGGGTLENTSETVTGFKISADTGNITAGKVVLYGLPFSPSSGGGGGGGGWFAGGTMDGTSIGGTGSATKGTCFTPAVDVSIEYAQVYLDAAATSDVYRVEIATVTPSTGLIGSVVATSDNFSADSTNPEFCMAPFSTPPTLTGGTDYIFVLVNTSGGGGTNCRIGFGDTCPNMPVSSLHKISYNYNTIGLSASQAASSSTAIGDIYTIFPCGYIA